MSNILKGTTCTVIGPMQHSTDGREVRSSIAWDLAELGITMYDHYNKPFIDSVKEDEEVHAKIKTWLKEENYDAISERRKIRTFDLKLIDISDFIIFHFTPDVLTCGSWEEFFWANRLKKPIFFINSKGKNTTPIWVFWTIPHKYIYSSVEDCIQRIKDIDSGAHPIDSERWKLLKTEYR